MIGAVTRVTWSVEPPAPHGTMMLIGPPGFQSWAAAWPPTAASDNAASAPARVTAFRHAIPPGIRLLGLGRPILRTAPAGCQAISNQTVPHPGRRRRERQRPAQQRLERVVVLGVEAADALQPDAGGAQAVRQQPADDEPAGAASGATRPARARMWRCLEIAASDIACGSARSPTVRSPSSSAVRIARRVGSASAAKTRSRSVATRPSGVLRRTAAKVNRSVDGRATRQSVWNIPMRLR